MVGLRATFDQVIENVRMDRVDVNTPISDQSPLAATLELDDE
jgi:hypothetical protein